MDFVHFYKISLSRQLRVMEQIGNQSFLESLEQVTWAENGKANATGEKVKEKTSDGASIESGTQLQWEMQAYQYPAEERDQINSMTKVNCVILSPKSTSLRTTAPFTNPFRRFLMPTNGMKNKIAS
jgi:hypothetical protein